MTIKPQEARDLTFELRRAALELLDATLSSAGNDQNPDLEDRQIVHEQYRRAGMDVALRLLDRLRLAPADFGDQSTRLAAGRLSRVFKEMV